MNKILDIKIEMPEIDLSSNAILHISIDGEWSAFNFNEFFYHFDIVYRNKFWIYKAFIATVDFISKPENTKVNFLQFAHTPLARLLDTVKFNLKGLGSTDFETKIVFNDTFHTIMGHDRLTVKKIIYASPGITDFLGIAGILKEIKETLMYYFPNQKDKENIEILKQQKVELQIKNLRSIGFTEIEIKSIFLREEISVDKISNLIKNDMIRNVEIISNGDQ